MGNTYKDEGSYDLLSLGLNIEDFSYDICPYFTPGETNYYEIDLKETSSNQGINITSRENFKKYGVSYNVTSRVSILCGNCNYFEIFPGKLKEAELGKPYI